MGSTSDGSPSPLFSLMRRTASGSRTSATSSAPARSLFSGCSTDLAATLVDHDASAKTMITTTPSATANRMALSRTELLGEWIGAPCKVPAMPTTQNATAVTATAGMTTSSNRRERTGQFFNPRRDLLCVADGPVRECWWPPADRPLLSGRLVGPASCTAAGSRRNASVRPPRVSPVILGLTSCADPSACPCGLSLFVLETSPTTRRATVRTTAARKISASIPAHIRSMAGVMRARRRIVRY